MIEDGTMTTKELVQSSLELSIAERIQAVEAIWDTIAESDKELRFSKNEIEGFEKEVRDYENDPSSGLEWNKFKSTL